VAIDAENAKARAEADKAAEAKKVALRRAALKTIAPIEPEAVISNGLETKEFIDLIRGPRLAL
jgi:ribosomal 50S subunit-recycling heat shock protein